MPIYWLPRLLVWCLFTCVLFYNDVFVWMTKILQHQAAYRYAENYPAFKILVVGGGGGVLCVL